MLANALNRDQPNPKSWGEWLKELVLDPLGMNNTYASEFRPPPRVAQGQCDGGRTTGGNILGQVAPTVRFEAPAEWVRV